MRTCAGSKDKDRTVSVTLCGLFCIHYLDYTFEVEKPVYTNGTTCLEVLECP